MEYIYIKKIITDIGKKCMSSGSKWELLKYKLREYSITYGINLKKKRQEEVQLIQEINKRCCKSVLTDEDKDKLISLHSLLDELYIRKAKGAYVRSRAKWMEEGEKNSSYFCNLEKRRQERNVVGSLLIHQKECYDNNTIVNEVFQFYSNLYASSYSSDNANKFFKKVKNMSYSYN